jgi:drug/metabolite transporter (DMT)-like permease
MNNVILYALTVMIWGSTWYAITFQLGVVDPIVSLAYRFGLASVILLVFLTLTKQLKTAIFTPQQHGFIALQGILLFSLNYWFFYMGTGHITSGLVAVVFSSISIMNALNQAMIFKIKLRKQVVFGSLFGLCGIAAVFWPELTGSTISHGTTVGIGLCIAASYLASLGNMASLRNTRDDIPVMQASAFGMGYGAACSLIIALIKGAEFTFEPTIGYSVSLLYLALFGSAIAFGCYLTLLKNIGADKAAYAAVMFPIVALLISTVFDGYIWTPQALAGMGLVIIGNIITMTNRESLLHWRKRKAKELLK